MTQVTQINIKCVVRMRVLKGFEMFRRILNVQFMANIHPKLTLYPNYLTDTKTPDTEGARLFQSRGMIHITNKLQFVLLKR